MNDLLQSLAQVLHAEWRNSPASHRGYHADCPNCGKPAKRGQKHFFFSEKGYICWACDFKGGLIGLAKYIGLDTGEYKDKPVYQAPQKPKTPLETFSRDLIAEYTQHPQRVALWQSYKPVRAYQITEYNLGVGYLPKPNGSRYKDLRLIIPIIRDNRVVMLRGRSLPDSKHPAKWLTRGSPARLFNADKIKDGDTVLIFENWIDCLLCQHTLEDRGEFTTIPIAGSAGASGWQAAWSKLLALKGVKMAGIALDNDTAGKGGNIKIMASLQQVGIATQAYRFQADAPQKASLMDVL